MKLSRFDRKRQAFPIGFKTMLLIDFRRVRNVPSGVLMRSPKREKMQVRSGHNLSVNISTTKRGR